MRFKTLLANLTLANQLTFLRLVAVPFFILAVLEGRFTVALVIFAAAGVTDLADGLIARWFQQGTPLGTYLDPAADKLLLTVGFILLTDYPSMFQGIEMAARIPIWLTILTISRDVLIVAVALILYLATGMTSFPPTALGKLTAGCESLTIGLFLLFNALGRWAPLLEFMIWGTLALTLLSGFNYLWRTVRALRAGEEPSAAAPAHDE
jgi:cardiolipin synthase